MPINASTLTGKTVLITGASRGIGAAIAELFAAQGARLALCARGDLTAIGERCRALTSHVAEARFDVSDAAAVKRGCAELREAVGPFDIVVNNAGNVVRRPFAGTSIEEWHRTFAVNVDGSFYVTQAVALDLQERRGRVINIASIAGREGTPMLAAYCAAKHAVVGLTRALAEEWRDAGVAVNAICPGSVDTELLQIGLPGATPQMSPSDVAAVALFLARDAPPAMTGSCLDVFG